MSETIANEVATTLALAVKNASIEMLDDRRRGFFREMITSSAAAMSAVEAAGIDEEQLYKLDIDALQALYRREDVYDAIWLEGDTTADYNNHQADDYHEGYEAGAKMVLEHLHRLFGIEPPAEES
jgi:hypothetical protein